MTMPAGQTTGTIDVPILGDGTNEADETFGISLSNPVNATIDSGSATGTIVNDDSATVSITAAPRHPDP